MQNRLSYREVRGRRISEDFVPLGHGREGGQVMMEEERIDGESREEPWEGNRGPCLKNWKCEGEGVCPGILNWSKNWGIIEIVYPLLSD